jgi:hypothetical protein
MGLSLPVDVSGTKAQLSGRIASVLFSDPAKLQELRAELAGKEGILHTCAAHTLTSNITIHKFHVTLMLQYVFCNTNDYIEKKRQEAKKNEEGRMKCTADFNDVMLEISQSLGGVSTPAATQAALATPTPPVSTLHAPNAPPPPRSKKVAPRPPSKPVTTGGVTPFSSPVQPIPGRTGYSPPLMSQTVHKPLKITTTPTRNVSLFVCTLVRIFFLIMVPAVGVCGWAK